MAEKEMILVLDFGGQYNQLIARRVRELSVYSEVRPYTMPIEEIRALNPTGIILTGGPDVVFCGINAGYNIASDIQYSATVGAALEASNHHIHTIAFSESHEGTHEVTDKYIEQLASELIDKPLGRNEIWNVNFPNCSVEECRGIKYDTVVSQDDFYAGGYDVVAKDGNKVSYIVNFDRNWDGTEGTDLKAIIDNYVSVGKVKNYS